MHANNRTDRGYATRQWPITENRPEIFLPIDSTIIDRIFAGREDDDRVSEVVVKTNECVVQTVQDYLPATEFEKPTVSAFTVAA